MAADLRRMSDANMRFRAPSTARKSRQNGTLSKAWLKERFSRLIRGPDGA
jgi:hypothetical protein